MKKLAVILILLGGIIYACNHTGSSSPTSTKIYNAFCYGSTADSTCPILPVLVNESFTAGYDSFLDSVHQPPLDVFSWQTFIALNWPADSAGKPTGSAITDKPNAPRVWEHYQDPAEVFGQPIKELTLRLGEAKQGGQKFLYLDSKAPTVLTNGLSVDAAKLNGFKEADGHPLIDRNLNFTLYEIKMNPIETKFIIDNGLTTTEGIYNAAQKNGNIMPALPASDSTTKALGSMEIKASWRILLPGSGDDTTRYYCRKATIYIDSLHTSNKKPLLIKNVTVGLVGMHIIRNIQKLTAAEVWSTFEHIDNTPDNPQETQQSGRIWSYYNPICLNCTPNTPPKPIKGDSGRYIWQIKMPYAALYATTAPGQTFKPAQTFGTQAVRTYPIFKYTEILNRIWQEKLKGSVWANYRLIGSQWKDNEVEGGPTAPNFLANTTLETYIQNNASCISCHSGAAIVFKTLSKPDTIKTNFSFVIAIHARNVLPIKGVNKKK